MGTALSQWRHWLREQKNSWIQSYFNWRILATPDPYRVALRPRPYRVLLILSHMRSGSSLLTHLLTSNPEIIGYGETHLEYGAAADFKALLQRVYWHAHDYRSLADVQRLLMGHTYMLDKVLHDKKFLSLDFLPDPQVYGLFLLREPVRSLASIADLKPHWSEQDALAYYQQRLATLITYAQCMQDRQRMFVVTYEQLLDQTEPALVALQQFLQTRVPFSEAYEVNKNTGMKGVGDPKGNIKAGRIVRSQRPLTRDISPDLLASAQATYEHASTQLFQLCSSLDRPFPLPNPEPL